MSTEKRKTSPAQLANLNRGHVPGVTDSPAANAKRAETQGLQKAFRRGMTGLKATDIARATLKVASDDGHPAQIQATRLCLELEGSLKRRIELTVESAGWMERAGEWFAAQGFSESQYGEFAAYVAGEIEDADDNDDPGD